MIKKLKQWVKRTIKRTFTPNKAAVNHMVNNAPIKPNKPDTAAEKVDKLKARLTNLKLGYGSEISKLEGKYHKHQKSYNDAYADMTDALNGCIYDRELKEARNKIQPFEKQVQVAKQELEKATELLQGDTYGTLQDIERLQDEYTEYLAREIKIGYGKMLKAQQDYFQNIATIGNSLRAAGDTEDFLIREYRRKGLPYNPTLVNMLDKKTDGLPIHVTDLEITQLEVHAAMRGNITTTK